MTQTTDLAIHGAECRTLAERLSEGAIPVTQALRYATLLGESLRKIHDSGKGHGAVSPETILLTAEGLELGPPAESAGPADIQADIFAFGTVLDEMLTSSPGDSPTDAGEHGAGALIAACLARDPAGRPPTMHKALLELKLASLSARHSGMGAARRRDSEAAVRAEIESAEARQEARIREHEIRAAEKEQAASDALNSMRTEMTALEAKLERLHGSAEASASRLGDVETGVHAAIQQLDAKFDDAVRKIEQEIGAVTAVLESVRRSMTQTDDLIGRLVETVEEKLSAAQRSAEENAGRIEILERAVQAAADQNAKLEARLVDGMRRVQADIQAQAATVESVRTSMAQTDDLVGRVVEAVESVLDVCAARP